MKPCIQWNPNEMRDEVICFECGTKIRSFEWNYCPVCSAEIEHTHETTAVFENIEEVS